MIADMDVWRAAAVMISYFGDRAETEAQRTLSLMLCRGDSAGGIIWSSIWRAVRELEALPTQGGAAGEPAVH